MCVFWILSYFFHSLLDIFFNRCPSKWWHCGLCFFYTLKTTPESLPLRIFFPLLRKHLRLLERQHTGPASGSTWSGRQSRSCLWASETEPEDESRLFMWSVGTCWSGWWKSSGWWTVNRHQCSAASCLPLCSSQWPSYIPIGCRASLLWTPKWQIRPLTFFAQKGLTFSNQLWKTSFCGEINTWVCKIKIEDVQLRCDL